MQLSYYQKYIEKLINQNPVQIVIARSISVSDGYKGNVVTTSDLPAQTMTFYNKKYQKPIMNEAGKVYNSYLSRMDKLLCKADADILEGDTFTDNGKRYRVVNVSPYMGICKQVELELIS